MDHHGGGGGSRLVGHPVLKGLLLQKRCVVNLKILTHETKQVPRKIFFAQKRACSATVVNKYLVAVTVKAFTGGGGGGGKTAAL